MKKKKSKTLVWVIGSLVLGVCVIVGLLVVGIGLVWVFSGSEGQTDKDQEVLYRECIAEADALFSSRIDGCLVSKYGSCDSETLDWMKDEHRRDKDDCMRFYDD